MQAFGLAAATGEQPASIMGDLEDAGVLRSDLEAARAEATRLVDPAQLFNLERHALDLLVQRVVDDDGIVDQGEYGQVFACSALIGADRMSDFSVARFQFGRVNAGFLPDPVEPASLILKRGETCFFDHQAHVVVEPKDPGVRSSAQPEPIAVPLGRRNGWSWRGSNDPEEPPTPSGFEIIDSGRVALTDRRMVFVGAQKSIDMRLNKLNAAWVVGPVLKLHRSDRVKPTLLEFPDASEDLAAALLVLLTRTSA